MGLFKKIGSKLSSKADKGSTISTSNTNSSQQKSDVRDAAKPAPSTAVSAVDNSSPHTMSKSDAELLAFNDKMTAVMDEAARRIEELNHGMTSISMFCGTGPFLSFYGSHYGYEDDRYSSERYNSALKPHHESYDLVNTGQVIEGGEKSANNVKLFNTDVECVDDYEAVVPGTIPVVLFGEELVQLAKGNQDRRIVYSVRQLPSMSAADVIERFNVLRELGSFRGFTADELATDLKPLIGTITQAFRGGVDDQVFELVQILNNTQRFTNFATESSTAAVMVRAGMINLAHHLLLANELRMRLPFANSTFFGIEEEIQTAMVIAKRWAEGVQATLDETNANYKMRSNVHERQISGLVRFAELIDWPYMESARAHIEDTYTQLLAGENFDCQIWDWIFGVTLPGKYASMKIMSALVMLTPEMKHLKQMPYYNSGLYVEGKTYWRIATVLGRVLGGCENANSAMHWVGPCPTINEGLDEDFTMGYIHLKARSVPVSNLETYSEKRIDGESDSDWWVDELDAKAVKKNPEIILTRLTDKNDYIEPDPIPKPSESVTLDGLYLRKLPPDLVADADQTVLYQATIKMNINDRLESFTLYSNPIFVCSTPCIAGPHLIHKHTRKTFAKSVVEVKDLKKTHKWQGILFINTQGQHDADVAARAWCAERSYHAVVNHTDTCLVCLREQALRLCVDVVIYR